MAADPTTAPTNLVGQGGLEEARALYLDLLVKCLTMSLWRAADGEQPQPFDAGWHTRAKLLAKRALGRAAPEDRDPQTRRRHGRDWPALAFTMIGEQRLEHLRWCVEDVLRRNVPGDLIEAGVWRGGATILMRGVLKAYAVTNRRVWVADSFAGLPPPDAERFPADRGAFYHEIRELAVSLDEVKANFASCGLLDDQVAFLAGWFAETLPAAPISELAVIRLDGDLYESTMDSLTTLYPKLAPGGFLIVDDYCCIPACRQAVEDYRSAHGIREPIERIDWSAAFWRRTAPPAA